VLEPRDTVAMARIRSSKGVLEIMPIKGSGGDAGALFRAPSVV